MSCDQHKVAIEALNQQIEATQKQVRALEDQRKKLRKSIKYKDLVIDERTFQ